MKELLKNFQEKRWIYLGITALILSLIGAIYIIYFSDLFLLKEIKVKAEGDFSKREIIKMSGLKGGERLYRISLEEVRKRIMKDPRIGNVIIARRLPCTLEIIIKEREPVGIIRKGREYYLIDRHGILIEKAKRENFDRYPVLVVKNKNEKNRLLSFLSWLKHNGMYLPVYENLKKIILKGDRVIFLTRRSGIRIYFPVKSEKNWKYFYRNLDRIMTYLYEKKLIHNVELIRFDYPTGEALIRFKKKESRG
jgi:cell division protein FtsQ